MIDKDGNFLIFISIYISNILRYNVFENLDMNEEKCLICKEIKSREIFWPASSLEKLTKALLPAFGVILVSPVFMSKKQKI